MLVHPSILSDFPTLSFVLWTDTIGPGGVWRLRWACGGSAGCRGADSWVAGCGPIGSWGCRWILEVEQKTVGHARLSEAPIRSHIPRRFDETIWQQAVWGPGILSRCWLPMFCRCTCVRNSSEVKLHPASHGTFASTTRQNLTGCNRFKMKAQWTPKTLGFSKCYSNRRKQCNCCGLFSAVD